MSEEGAEAREQTERIFCLTWYFDGVESTRQTYLSEEIAASSMEEAAAHVEARLDAPAVRIPDPNGLLLCPVARIV